jgi:N-acetylglutamate synthase-like GNAT family acetyltransferase
MKIRCSTNEDFEVISTFLGQAGLSTNGLEEQQESFFILEDEIEKAQAVIGYEQEGNDALLRSLVVSPTIYSQHMVLFLQSVLSKLSEQNINRVYLLTKQNVVQDLFLLLGFEQTEDKDVSNNIKEMNHYKTTIKNENILVYQKELYTNLSTN